MTGFPAPGAVAVLGAGREGVELTLLCLRAGIPTIVEDVFPDKLRSLRALAGAEFGDSEASGLLRFAATIEDAIRAAGIVLDSVPDELESKLEIFSLVDRMARPGTILCSPLREVSIADVAACTSRPEFCAGIRTTPDRESWLTCSEVVISRGPSTAPATVEAVRLLWQKLGKRANVQLDQPDNLPAAD